MEYIYIYIYSTYGCSIRSRNSALGYILHVLGPLWLVCPFRTPTQSIPMGPCSYMVYTWALKVVPMSLPLGLRMSHRGTWTHWVWICAGFLIIGLGRRLGDPAQAAHVPCGHARWAPPVRSYQRRRICAGLRRSLQFNWKSSKSKSNTNSYNGN